MAPRFLSRAPAAGILGYYVALGVLLTVLFSVFQVQDLLPTGRVNAPVGLLQPSDADLEPVSPKFEGGMAIIALIGMVTAFSLVVPVAWVYMVTKAHRAYDQSVPQTVFILPIVIAGIVLIVRDSVTLAFSLAGIVAAVRFRNTLKDTKDAVYVFLAIGVGLASGVQAIDVAYVTSFGFSALVLGLWKVEMGPATVPVGAGAVSGPSTPNDKPINGVVTVHTKDPRATRDAVQQYFEGVTKRWNYLGTVDVEGGGSRIEYAVRMKRSADPAAVVEAIKSRGRDDVQSVEFRPVGEEGLGI